MEKEHQYEYELKPVMMSGAKMGVFSLSLCWANYLAYTLWADDALFKISWSDLLQHRLAAIAPDTLFGRASDCHGLGKLQFWRT